MKRLQNAWVFVSHSTQDIDRVRLVRNEIEVQGGEALLFFLKCVSDTDELDDLLKREIEARRYFLLCDSSAASASKWVQDEILHVNSLKGKRVETLSLSDSWQDQVLVVRRLLRRATIFPCYVHSDRSLVNPLLATLRSKEFGIFDAFDRQGPVAELGEEINRAIDSSGYFLDFLSSASLDSPWCRLEARYFLESLGPDSTYIPVLLEPNLPLDSVPEARMAIDISDRSMERFATELEAILYGGTHVSGLPPNKSLH